MTSRSGRNMPAAVGSAVVLVAAILGSLLFWKPAFVAILATAVAVGVWELANGFKAKQINLPEEPLIFGGALVVILSYLFGSVATIGSTAVVGLIVMLWLLRRGVSGYVRNATAAIFTLFYLPFLASFVALLTAENLGVKAVISCILITVASDIGGFFAGVFFGKHPMAPIVSPKKSWEGFAGSVLLCAIAGGASVHYLLHGNWLIGVVLGVLVAAVATLGDLCESVIKRDLGIKDMSNIIPGHGGLMDRLDSLLMTAAPVWLVFHFLVL